MPIFDQGYQHWQGTLSGHGWRWLTVARHGIRIGMTNRLLRLTVLLAWLPSLCLAAVLCLWGVAERQAQQAREEAASGMVQPPSGAVALLAFFMPNEEVLRDPAAFRLPMWALSFRIFLKVEMYFTMILVLMVGPSLISQDLRFNALPLYFSRPVQRSDYFVGKLAIIAYFLALVAVVPAAAAWLLGVFFSLEFSVFLDTLRILGAVVVYGLIVAGSAGLLMLALSSLSRNSRYVGAFWAGFWLLSGTVSVILEGVHQSQYGRRVYREAAVVQEERMRSEAARQKEFVDAQREEHQERLDRKQAKEDAGNLRLTAEEREARAAERRRQAGRRAQEHHARQARLVHERQQAEAREKRESVQRIKAVRAEFAANDWRPCVAYTDNLLRLGDALLGADDARDRYDALLADAARSRRGDESTLDEMYRPPTPRWPWYWSAAILLALAGASLWILTTRVKSLDRLR
jgi:ABC-2 type transport system permease protein